MKWIIAKYLFFPDFIRRAILFASSDIQEFKVIQHSVDKIEMKLKALPENLELCQSKVMQELHTLWSTKSVRYHIFSFHITIFKYMIKKLKRIESFVRRGEHK